MKTRKILSVILSLAMLLGAVNFVMPVSAAVKVDRAYSGSGEIEVANNTDAKVEVQGDIAFVGGKTDGDVAGYLAVKNGEKLTHGGGHYLPSIWWSTGIFNKKIAIAFDIMFTSDDAKLHMENQTLDADGNSSARNPFIFIGPQKGIERGEGTTVVEYPENLPASLSCNEWHNIAFEVPYNGTNKFNIYIDGVKYECGADADMYGVYRYRLNIVSGSMYIDNYRCLEGEQADEIYPVADYAMQAASFTDSEKAALDAESGKIKILDSSLTVAELKAQLTAGEGESVTVFEDMTYKTVLADDAIVTQSAAVVVSNGKGAFRYLSFERTNDSDFEIEALGDGIGCRVLGYKDTVTPPTDKITIPDYIEGYKVTEIGTGAFDGVVISKGGRITLPDSVKVIGAKAFYDTTGGIYEWPSELESIGSSAFVHGYLYATAFPEKLKSIGSSAFQYAVLKVQPAFNEGLESIGKGVFEWSGLTKLVIPDSVVSLGNEIGRTCCNLTIVRFPRNEKVTKIPSAWFTSKDVKSEGYMFKDMSIYIPETITEIPDDFLINFADGKTVTIYGVPGSAAEDFYKMVKEGLKNSTYFNLGTYGTEGAYTDKDGDGKGELADIKFVEYNYELDCANVIDETGINKGDVLPKLESQENDPVFEANYPGVGGKTADDVVLRLYSKGGGGGKNYINEAGNGTKFVREISICVPETSAVRSIMGYFTTSAKKDYANIELYNISTKGVYALGQKVCNAKPGQWFNIVTVVDNGGSKNVAVYINGEKFEKKLETGSYGVRHFRDSPELSANHFNVYYDNLRCYTTEEISYNVMADAPATVASKSIDIKITDKGIIYVYDDASYTVSELLSKLDVNEESNANLRVYSDWSFTEELEADDVIGKGAVLVVAAKNGYSFERTYSYININPEVNRTIYDFEVISESNKTARVTGFFDENLIDTDDLSAIKIPESIMGYTITEIGANSFKADTRIQSVVIPDTVTVIGANAFSGEQRDGKTYGTIKEVKLSKNLKEIGQYAFACNSQLTAIELPEGLTKIGNQAFYWTGLKEISIPDTVTSLGSNNFRLCYDLKYAKLPSGVTNVDGSQFSAGVSLTDLVVPESVTNIGTGVFGNYDMDLTVYGVEGSYAESWANGYGFKFVGVNANTLLAAPKILGDGTKVINGTDYDIDYGFETLTFDGKLINIGKTDLEAMAAIALYDTEGRMVEMISKDITIPAERNVEIKDYDVTIPAGKIADGYTVKGFVWRKSNIEPVSDAFEILFDKTKQEVHVLLIGNSFGNDSFEYIEDVAKADGVILKSQNMYIGSATLNVHYTNMFENAAKYQPVINGVYGSTLITMQEGLSSDKWNVVALQCGTHGFNYDDEFVDFAKEGSVAGDKFAYIRDYVKTYAPEATRVMHMSWGPCDEQSRALYGARFADETLYPDASKAVFEAQKAAYEYGSTIFANEANMMVPTSYAVWHAIDELGFYEHSGPKGSDNKYSNPVAGTPSLFRDETCHLTTGTSPYGRVLASLTWYGYVTGNDVTECKYQHPGISEEDMAKLKIAAQWATEQVTPVTGTAQ